VFSRQQDFIYFYALMIDPAESGRSLCNKVFFKVNEAKLNQDVSKDGQDHKLGDAQGTLPYHQKSQFANF
jgi:hypothetical protein